MHYAIEIACATTKRVTVHLIDNYLGNHDGLQTYSVHELKDLGVLGRAESGYVYAYYLTSSQRFSDCTQAYRL